MSRLRIVWPAALCSHPLLPVPSLQEWIVWPPKPWPHLPGHYFRPIAGRCLNKLPANHISMSFAGGAGL